MTPKHWLIAGTTLALGVAWMAGPALAQQTTGEKIENKVERAKDKAEVKADRAADKVEDKAERAKDKAEVKADRAADKTESTVDRAKDKARDVTDKVKDKTSELTDKAKDKMDQANAANDRQEVMAMQRSLREKGHNPGPVDGIVGPRTRAALMDYQKKEGLSPSGQWDDDTKSRLGLHASAAPDKTTVSASPADPRGEKPSTSTPPPSKRQAP